MESYDACIQSHDCILKPQPMRILMYRFLCTHVFLLNFAIFLFSSSLFSSAPAKHQSEHVSHRSKKITDHGIKRSPVKKIYIDHKNVKVTEKGIFISLN